MKAFKGIVKAESGLLIGGTKQHESYPFSTQESALAWAQVVVVGNLQAGRKPGLPQVEQVEHWNPITA